MVSADSLAVCHRLDPRGASLDARPRARRVHGGVAGARLLPGRGLAPTKAGGRGCSDVKTRSGDAFRFIVSI
jgi:hypothetical protein